MTRKDQILEAVRIMNRPTSADEIADVLDLDNAGAVSPYLTELFRSGQVERFKQRKPGHASRFAYTLPQPEPTLAFEPPPVRQEAPADLLGELRRLCDAAKDERDAAREAFEHADRKYHAYFDALYALEALGLG